MADVRYHGNENWQTHYRRSPALFFLKLAWRLLGRWSRSVFSCSGYDAPAPVLSARDATGIGALLVVIPTLAILDYRSGVAARDSDRELIKTKDDLKRRATINA